MARVETAEEIVRSIMRLEEQLTKLSSERTPYRVFNIKTYGAKGDATLLDSNVTTTSGSAVVSCPAASFTPKDEGKLMCVRGALNTIIVNAVIASVQSSTQATLAANANASTSTGTALYGTDNTAAIQAAMNDAASFGQSSVKPYRWKGALLHIPPGAFLTDMVTRQHHVTIAGHGDCSVLVMKPVSSASALITTDVHACFTPVRNLRLDLRGDFQTQSAGTGPHGIYFDYSANPDYNFDEEGDPYPLLKDLTIYNARGSGVKLIGRGETMLSHVRVRNAAGDGITTCFDSHVLECSVGVVGGAGFNIGNGALGGSVRIANSKAFHCGNPLLAANAENWSTSLNGGAGFYIAESQAVAMANCEAQDVAGAGFALSHVLDSVFTSCVVDSCSAALQGSPGWDLSNCHRNRIDGHVRDRGPGERTGETIGGVASHYAVRHAYRSWFINGADGPANNVVKLTTDLNPNLANHYLVYPKAYNSNATEGEGETVVIDGQEGNQTVAYDPSFATSGWTPNPYVGGRISMTLTGNLIINEPAANNKHYGVEMTFVLTQDAAGGRSITFAAGSSYRKSWTPSTGSGAVNTITFYWNGSVWAQLHAATGLT